MRILIVIDGLSGGGAEKVVITLSQGFIEMGHRVSIFSLRERCDYSVPKGVDFHIIKDQCKYPWRKFFEISRYAKLLDHAIMVAERNSEKFDICFSHLYKTDRIITHSKYFNSRKIWLCIHSMLSFSYLHSRKGLSRWLKHIQIAKTYKNRNVVAVSSAVLNDIQHTLSISTKRNKVIYNPFFIDKIQHQAEEHFEMKNMDYLIHVGRFHYNKRQDRLLRAYAISNLDVPLVMIGSGSKKIISKLKELSKKLRIDKKVFFRPFVKNPYSWIKGARFLVLSSDYEGFGNVLVEAMICQTPVVSTKCPGGPEEILQGSFSQGLVELNDEALAKKLYDFYHYPPVIKYEKNLFQYCAYLICQKYLSLAKVK